jgi:hypothetical protein
MEGGRGSSAQARFLACARAAAAAFGHTHRPELAGAPFEAMGVSLVFHPRNPGAHGAHECAHDSAGHEGSPRPAGLAAAWI